MTGVVELSVNVAKTCKLLLLGFMDDDNPKHVWILNRSRHGTPFGSLKRNVDDVLAQETFYSNGVVAVGSGTIVGLQYTEGITLAVYSNGKVHAVNVGTYCIFSDSVSVA